MILAYKLIAGAAAFLVLRKSDVKKTSTAGPVNGVSSGGSSSRPVSSSVRPSLGSSTFYVSGSGSHYSGGDNGASDPTNGGYISSGNVVSDNGSVGIGPGIGAFFGAIGRGIAAFNPYTNIAVRGYDAYNSAKATTGDTPLTKYYGTDTNGYSAAPAPGLEKYGVKNNTSDPVTSGSYFTGGSSPSTSTPSSEPASTGEITSGSYFTGGGQPSYSENSSSSEAASASYFTGGGGF